MTKKVYSKPVVRRALHAHIIFKLLNLFFAFGFQIIIIKNLQPRQFASYATLLGILMSAQTFLTFGIDRAIQRFVPNYIQLGDATQLRILGGKLGIIRLTSLVIFTVALYLGAGLVKRIMPMEVDSITLVTFAAWFIATLLFADGDAVAQSCVAHLDLALVYTMEILARTGAILFLLAQPFVITAQTVVAISALTSTSAVIVLYLRLARRWKNFRKLINGQQYNTEAALDVHHAPRFAIAWYISGMSWFPSSPAVIRLVASTGLGVVAFSAFSFCQGLFIAIQKGLPGTLLLPSLEPLIVAELSDQARHDRIYAAMSLTFKVELVGILIIVMGTALAGNDMLRIISKPEYAPYYFVMPTLALLILFSTMYRTLEIIGNLKFRQRQFLLLWPLSLLSLLAIYLTVHRWGLLSVILWPIAEYVAKLCILVTRLGKDGAWNAFDQKRSILVVVNAAVILGIAFLLRALFDTDSGFMDVSIALGSIIIFCVSILVLRPLRPVESDTASMLLPLSWSFARHLVLRLSRP